MAVPKWFEFGTATAPIPWALARRITSGAASAVNTWPMPSWPSMTPTAPLSTICSGVATGFAVPASSRATYQGNRITPWDGCPHRSA